MIPKELLFGPSLAALVGMPSLVLSSNDPITVPPNSKCTAQTTQAASFLQIENLSQSFTLLYFVTAGTVLTQSGSIPAGGGPLQWTDNFNGAELVVANVSTMAASMEVTLISS